MSYRAVRDGIIPEDAICELGKIIIGEQAGRTNEQEKILFNPIGMSIHDVSEAYRVYQNALKQGIGQGLSLWEQAYWT